MHACALALSFGFGCDLYTVNLCCCCVSTGDCLQSMYRETELNGLHKSQEHIVNAPWQLGLCVWPVHIALLMW